MSTNALQWIISTTSRQFVNFSKPSVGTSMDNWTLRIDGLPIREVNVSKFLGVYIDRNVSWRAHIGRLITRISQTVGIIGRARGFMDGPQLMLLYNAIGPSPSSILFDKLGEF